MPIIRYFLFVGGTLLGLLFLVDRQFPLQPGEASGEEVDRSIIRIHSAREWPAATPINTNVPMPQPITNLTTAIANKASPAKATDAPSREAYAFVPTSSSKPAGRPTTHRIKAASHWPVRNMHPRLASSQPNWFPTW